jgi:hypothetical protein
MEHMNYDYQNGFFEDGVSIVFNVADDDYMRR